MSWMSDLEQTVCGLLASQKTIATVIFSTKSTHSAFPKGMFHVPALVDSRIVPLPSSSRTRSNWQPIQIQGGRNQERFTRYHEEHSGIVARTGQRKLGI